MQDTPISIKHKGYCKKDLKASYKKKGKSKSFYYEKKNNNELNKENYLPSDHENEIISTKKTTPKKAEETSRDSNPGIMFFFDVFTHYFLHHILLKDVFVRFLLLF